MEQDIINRLKAEFPKQAISWRAQSLTRDGLKAMALAYIDARDVMNRLDEAVGAENWSDSYLDSGKRTYCTISIKTEETANVWVSKSDAAGDSEVEAEKGAVSDSFKRAAVKWGIGRYLYDLPAPWVPCETYEKNGKKVFSKFTEDPWNYVKQTTPKAIAPKTTAKAKKERWQEIMAEFADIEDIDQLSAFWVSLTDELKEIKERDEESYLKLEDEKNRLKAKFNDDYKNLNYGSLRG